MVERIADAIAAEVDNVVRGGQTLDDGPAADESHPRLADEAAAPFSTPEIDPLAPPVAVRDLQADLDRWNATEEATRSSLQSPSSDRRRARVQSVDPTVSRTKFDREVDAYRRHEDAYRSRGWLLIEAAFPSVFLVLCVPQLRPQCVLFGVILDFTNYDVEPISVKIVDAFTRRPLAQKALLTVLPRKPRAMPQNSEPLRGLSRDSKHPQPVSSPVDVGPQFIEVPGLLQSWGPNDPPFMCLPGVLEYHRHPAHSGDSWLRYRGSAVGRLDAILNAFHTYGVRPINSYHVNVSLQQHPDGTASIVGAQINGFRVTEIPE